MIQTVPADTKAGNQPQPDPTPLPVPQPAPQWPGPRHAARGLATSSQPEQYQPQHAAPASDGER